jgi:hypothetical protein
MLHIAYDSSLIVHFSEQLSFEAICRGEHALVGLRNFMACQVLFWYAP